MNKKEGKQVRRLILIIVIAVVLIIAGFVISLIEGYVKQSKKGGKANNIGGTESSVEAIMAEEDPYPMYIDSADMITSHVMDSMKSQGVDAIRAEIADKWVNVTKEYAENGKLYCQIQNSSPNIEYVGYYFQHSKDSNTTPIKNRIYLIYKVEETLDQIWTEHGSENKDDWQVYSGTANYYVFVRFEQIQLIDSETATVDVTKYEIPDRVGYQIDYKTGVSQGWGVDAIPWAYSGFTDFMTFENKELVPEMDKYSYESDIDKSKLIPDADAGVIERDHTEYMNSIQIER